MGSGSPMPAPPTPFSRAHSGGILASVTENRRETMNQMLIAIENGRESTAAVKEAIAAAGAERATVKFVGALRRNGLVQPGTTELLRRRRELDHNLAAA